MAAEALIDCAASKRVSLEAAQTEDMLAGYGEARSGIVYNCNNRILRFDWL